ncbi:MAG: diacylglycerol kinase family lipid kinase [Anaerolineae bacterium]|nr:diacylglycerol kinase family lipid kinase [Anaerolineae bacterium]
MRVQVILNPWADRGRAVRLKDDLGAWGAQHGGLEVVLTQSPGHAAMLARAAAEAGYDRIGIAGGDGTVHEVVNGLVGVPAVDQPAVGLIPIGSGNDYAFGAGLLAPAHEAVERLYHGEVRAMDLAKIVDDHGRTRHVINGIGIGFDAAIAIATSKIKRLHGFAAYFVAALQTIALHYERPQFDVHFDDNGVSQPSLLLAIGVGPRIGGGFLLTPDAAFDDGLLDSCLVDSVGRFTMLRMLPRVMKGTHITADIVQMRRSRTIDLRSDLPLPVHLDGEIFATAEDDVHELTIEVVPGALALVF